MANAEISPPAWGWPVGAVDAFTPTAFTTRTTRAARLRPLVQSLTGLIAGRQTATTGCAETKEREEQELETLAHEIGQTLADWYEENGREGDSAQIDLSLSAWQRLRDTGLIAKSRLLHQKLTAALGTNWQEWEIPREFTADFLTAKNAESAKILKKLSEDSALSALCSLRLKEWWSARISRQQEIDQSIAAKADSEYLYDKPSGNKKSGRVSSSAG